MDNFYEVAYAAASKRLCLFTGTGFSKAVSDNAAPSWQQLLEDLCDLLPEEHNPKKVLFPAKTQPLLNLEEAAQVIELKHNEFRIETKKEIKKLIENVDLSDKNEETSKFFRERSFRVITTNYDKLAEELAGLNRSQTITPGLPIPRSSAEVKIYHVHGSTDSPENMVVTTEDYFDFMGSDSYFSRKLSTILHENTVVILGYSLTDTNLKRIISDYRKFSKSHVIGSNIIFVSRKGVNQYIKDFYYHCFGIRVWDNLEVEHFFKKLNRSIPTVEKFISKSLRSVEQVINHGRKFKDRFIKLEDSFYRFLSSLSARGYCLDDPRVVAVIGDILHRKKVMTAESGAWEQYEHLAGWLIHLGAYFEIRNTTIKNEYLGAVDVSMNTMSKDRYLGYSWKAYQLWHTGWPSINANNRDLIRNHAERHEFQPDALAIVNSTI